MHFFHFFKKSLYPWKLLDAILENLWSVRVSEMSEVTQLCPTLCDPMDCNLPGSSIHEIFRARVLEWVAISFSRGSSWPRDQTWVSHIAGRRFTIWPTREAQVKYNSYLFSQFKGEKKITYTHENEISTINYIFSFSF